MSTERRMPDDIRLTRLRAASAWLLRMQDPSRTEADIDEWLRWCTADPKNVAEFDKVQGDWRDLGALRSRGRAEPPADLRAEEATAPVRQLGPRHLGTKLAFATAACAGCIALAVLLWVRDRQAPRQVPRQIVATDMNRAATLPDGSRVILRPTSTLLVDYVPSQRNLDLLAGEVYFKVKHDRRHPFVVHAGDMRVIAVGTAFDVLRENGRTKVTVEEGIVRVTDDAWSKKGLPDSWQVAAGYQFTYSSQRRAEMIAATDVVSALRWRDGELAYVREPLGSVVEDLNRYSAHRIIIDDPAIAGLRFTGTAFTSSLRDWLKAIQQAYPVKVTDAPNGDIILTSRSDQRGAASAP